MAFGLYRKLISILVFFTVVLSGCKTTGVSLEEAKKITAEFKGSTFTPPPRRIDDLLSRLPEPDVAPTDDLAKRCAGVESDGIWVKRFEKYQTIYRNDQRIDRTVTPMGKWTMEWGWELDRGISILEMWRGNVTEAIAAQERYVGLIPQDKSGAKIPPNAHLAIIYLKAGRLEDAKRTLSNAHAMSTSLPHRPEKFRKRHDLWLTRAGAAIAAAEGDLKRAESLYRTGLIQFTELFPSSPEIALMKASLAEVLALQGRHLEAENEVREGLMISEKYNRLTNEVTVPVIYRLARILHDQKRYTEAAKISAAAVYIFQINCIPSHSVEFALARQSLAESLSMQGEWEKVTALFESIKRGMSGESEVFHRRFSSDLTWAMADIKLGQGYQIKDVLGRELERLQLQRGEEDPRTAEVRGFFAMALNAAGEKEKAGKHFFHSVRTLLEHTQRLGSGNFGGVRPYRVRILIDAYMDYLLEQAESSGLKQAKLDASDEIFRLVEFLRSSRVQQAVSAMGVRAAADNGELAVLLRQEQDARSQLQALEVTLSNALYADSGDAAQSIKQRLQRLRNAQSVLIEEIKRRFPEYASMMNPEPMSVASSRQVLREGEALVSAYVTDDRLFVWAIPKKGEHAFAAKEVKKQLLSQKVYQLREALEPEIETLGDLPDFDVALSHELFNMLLNPVKSGWKDARSLLVVAHGPLGYLPFSLLSTKTVTLGDERPPLFSRYRKVPWLIRDYAVSSLPSVEALKTLRRLPQNGKDARNAFVGFGDPLFNLEQLQASNNIAKQVAAITQRGLKVRGMPLRLRSTPQTEEMLSAELIHLPRLPDTADEIKDIAEALEADLQTDVYLGLLANEQQVKGKNLSNYRVVAFATHGLVPGDIDGLTQPALAFTSPKLVENGGDGLLTMDEIMGLNLDADWVILSACNTGSADSSGSEAISGLGRAFFYAGAKAILVSNWPVESSSAKSLTTELFKRQTQDSTLGRSQALQESMNQLIDGPGLVNESSGEVLFTYAHPIFWAPFTLVGDAGK